MHTETTKRARRAMILQYATPFIIAFLMNLLLEIGSQRSLWLALRGLFFRPHFFLLNFLIVSLTYAPSVAIRRKTFYHTVISGLWLALGITNFIVQSMRETPLEGTDFYILTTGTEILAHYLTPLYITLIIGGIVLFIFGLGVLFVKCKKRVSHPRGALVTMAVSILLTLSLALGLRLTDTIPDRYTNIVNAYRTYGFTWCFFGTVFDHGIDEPKEYNQELIDKYADRIGLGSDPAIPDEKPNILFVQLESFFDVARMKDLVFSEDPTPTFTQLQNDFPSGTLHVPSIGAGTANTEFEIISGMDLSYFGAGEYPYKTILLDTPCESTAFVLSDLGYNTHAIHNNKATFYSREECYPNLGFRGFTSVEYMNGVSYNPLGWAKDDVLTAEILSALDMTSGSDYIYTVSVQGHGGYPSQPLGETPIKLTSGLLDEEKVYAWEYYVNQLREMDNFLRELTEALAARDEKCILVLFGDHLPGGLGIEESSLRDGNLYATEYVIWSNYGLGGEDMELEAFQLAAKVLGDIGISHGSMVRLHQTMRDEPEYGDMIWAFQYDLLYGERYLTDGKPKYDTADMRYGSRDITIGEVIREDDLLTVKGENFNSFSRIIADGKVLETKLLEDGSLIAELDGKGIPDSISVGQFTTEDVLLSETAEHPIPDTRASDESEP